jgi:hypothetical protein
MCHGYHSGLTFDGLQLGAQNLTIRNLVNTTMWNPHLRTILIYACGAGNPGFFGPARSGRQFCRDLAGYSGADVYASDRNQLYHGASTTETINFGRWEGQVYRFSADGTITPARLPPQATSR